MFSDKLQIHDTVPYIYLVKIIQNKSEERRKVQKDIILLKFLKLYQELLNKMDGESKLKSNLMIRLYGHFRGDLLKLAEYIALELKKDIEVR